MIKAYTNSKKKSADHHHISCQVHYDPYILMEKPTLMRDFNSI